MIQYGHSGYSLGLIIIAVCVCGGECMGASRNHQIICSFSLCISCMRSVSLSLSRSLSLYTHTLTLHSLVRSINQSTNQSINQSVSESVNHCNPYRNSDQCSAAPVVHLFTCYTLMASTVTRPCTFVGILQTS